MGRQTYYYQNNKTKLSAVDVARVAYQAGFRGEDLVKAVAISRRESGWVPTIHGSDRPQSSYSGDRGLFQINSVNDAGLMSAGIIQNKTDLFNPAINAKAAYYLYQRAGNSFAPAWSVGNNGWDGVGDPLNHARQYLAEATEAVRQITGTEYTPVNPPAGGSGGGGTGESAGGAGGESAWGIPFIDVPGFGAIKDAGGAVVAFVGWFFNANNWIRILQVIGGSVLLVLGLWTMIGKEAVAAGMPVAQAAMQARGMK